MAFLVLTPPQWYIDLRSVRGSSVIDTEGLDSDHVAVVLDRARRIVGATGQTKAVDPLRPVGGVSRFVDVAICAIRRPSRSRFELVPALRSTFAQTLRTVDSAIRRSKATSLSSQPIAARQTTDSSASVSGSKPAKISLIAALTKRAVLGSIFRCRSSARTNRTLSTGVHSESLPIGSTTSHTPRKIVNTKWSNTRPRVLVAKDRYDAMREIGNSPSCG